MPSFRTLHYLRMAVMVSVVIVTVGPIQAYADIESRMSPLVQAVAAARPSVVNIRGRKTVREQVDYNSQVDKQVNGMGTGVVIDERGYIITNYHVIEGVAQIQVGLHDKTTTTARLIAHDPTTDLAIIKINQKQPLPVIKIGDSDTLMPAETVVAVGNAFGYEHTVTRGIVSELRRTVQVSENQVYYDLIQTDASINPGNSGGPLLNIDGEMIGINVAVRVGAQGIGFAIPVNEALAVAARLLAEQVATYPFHGLKTKTEFLDDGNSRVIVEHVDADSTAARAGVNVGDRVVKIGEIPVARSLDVERAFLDIEAGDQVEFSIERDGQVQVASASVETHSPGVTNEALCWSKLGLRLSPVGSREIRSNRYQGGMRVLAVRSSSPAAEQGIRAGDVLVGMHIWETVSYENVAYILSQPEMQGSRPFRFYILRGSETLWGNIQIASR